MRLQLDQLLEFKKAILESQAQLQKELQRAKQEAKEATIAKQTQMDDDYPEMLEMAMLDKEMAEEKVFKNEHLHCAITICNRYQL